MSVCLLVHLYVLRLLAVMTEGICLHGS